MQQNADTIRYLPYHKIDKTKWDICLQASVNPLIYATSLYLDNMCTQWDGLVMNDYEAIMPLPWNSKLGIRYVYSPFFVIGGGVFGKNLTADKIIQFIKSIPGKFLYLDIDFNEFNFFPDEFSKEKIVYTKRTNTLLSLQFSYQTLLSNYSAQAKRKIKKAATYNLQFSSSASVKTIVDLYCKHYLAKDKVVAKFDFTNMISFLQNQLADKTRTYLLSFPNGNVCAFYLLLFDKNYVYWLLGGSTEEGKKMGAFYYLTDKIISEFAGTNRMFRFEGSDIVGINLFNKQFGGQNVFYPRLIINRLPKLVRWLKN